MNDAEADQILKAAAFCRKYATMPTHRLLYASHSVWEQTIAYVTEAAREEWVPSLAENLLGAFVGWLLVWRLIFDQAEHDLSTRFGRQSAQLVAFRTARSAAYDTSRAYRIVEALRNMVQHREMPPLNLSRKSEIDSNSGLPTTKLSYTFPASWLLDSSKCPATIKSEFSQTPNVGLDLVDIVEQATYAIRPVLLELTKASTPELKEHIILLRELFRETSPVPPLLFRLKPLPVGGVAGGSQVEMRPLLDLADLIENAPIG